MATTLRHTFNLHLNDEDDGDMLTTYHLPCKEMNELITDSAWKDKELVHTRKKLNDLRKCQGFSKVERAFTAITKDPNFCNITESYINAVSSGEDDTVADADNTGNTVTNAPELPGLGRLDDWMDKEQTPCQTLKIHKKSGDIGDEFDTYSDLFEDFQRVKEKKKNNRLF
jgi:hypothetical protein